MKNFFEILIEVTLETIYPIKHFIKNNLVNFAKLLNFILPYLMFFVGQYVRENRGYIAIGGEMFIPVFFVIFTYYLKSSASKMGKGISIPTPKKRFTQVTEEGEVNIENKRVQELILYVADLEDWLERKGLL